MSAELFDNAPCVYDALIDWPSRLANEQPFYRGLFKRIGVRRVLDVACGTGRHAALFGSWGLCVEGADVSPEMIAHCRREHGQSDRLTWTVRAFDQPHPVPASFDAAICVGNSLALAGDPAVANHALAAMLSAVRANGVCVVQVVNLARLPEGPCVWQKTKRVRLADGDHVLVKGIHRVGARGFVEFCDLRLSATGVMPRFDSVPFLGLEADPLVAAARAAGATRVTCMGSFAQEPFDRERSQDLVLVAEK